MMWFDFLFHQKRYDFIVQNIDLLVRKAGYDSESVIYLPISGWKGDNLVKRSENLNWFKMWQIERKSGGASGRTLLDAIDAMERPYKMDRFPLRLSVHSVYKLGGSFNRISILTLSTHICLVDLSILIN